MVTNDAIINAAFIFPGQGAQKPGMGREFYESSPQARAVFEEADAVLNAGLKDVIFNGPAEKLTSTAYCQPAILTVSIAALKALEAHPKYRNISLKYAAGLSLGEYSALAASGALSFADTLRLVQKRSSHMEEATRLSDGRMAAVIGLDKDVIVRVCEKTGAEVANFNSHGQIVITGYAGKVEAASQALRDAGAKSVIPLEVSGAFHSSLMEPAAQKFSADLAQVTINPAEIPIVSNVTARPVTDPVEIRENLERQITSSVQWVDSMMYIAAQGVKDFVEIGPGKVLKGLARRIDSSLDVYNIEKPADIDQLPF
jgi:[acyl-carrier-protein] S-malonyltransferase